jgi:hypothetical protein
MRSWITQRQIIFYLLYKKFREGNGEYIPTWQFVGEFFIEEFNKWAFMSYEVSPRCSELNSMNPGLIERITVTGKSGAKYFAHRLTPKANIDLIQDPDLRGFYIRLRKAQNDILPR